MQTFRQFLIVDGTLQRVLGAKLLLQSDPLMLSLLIKLCVNTDVLKPRKVKGAPKPSHSAGSRRSVVASAGGTLPVYPGWMLRLI